MIWSFGVSLSVRLSGLYMQINDGKHVPVWIDYTCMEVDKKIVFDGQDSKAASYDHPYSYRQEVTNFPQMAPV